MFQSKAQEIYDQFINQQPSDYWIGPSEKGLETLRACKSAMMKFPGHSFFSGDKRHTYWTVNTVIKMLDRRIERWSRYLNTIKPEG